MTTLAPARRPLRPLLTFLKTGLGGLALLAVAWILLTAFPKPMFAYRAVYENYRVWSDQPIPEEIVQVLDDVTARLRTSSVHDRAVPIEIFFCNEPWRLWLYGRLFTTQLGGAADMLLTRHVFIRASDIAANRILPPGPGPIADAAQRPLSYYIAHEITHSDVSRRFGRSAVLRYPEWLIEGYADYVGKGGDFDFEENRALFAAGAPVMDRHRSGLYRGFHLRVAYLLDRKGWTLEQVFAKPPALSELDARLRAAR